MNVAEFTEVKLKAVIRVLLLCLLLIPSSVFSEEYIKEGPFVDLNDVRKITSKEELIFFTTKHGTKTYNRKTGQWNYDVSPVSAMTVDKDFYSLNRIAVQLPEWYPLSTYNEIVSLDNEKKYSWILTAIADEGATFFKQDLIHLPSKSVFQFPFSEIRTFLVTNDSIWLGSTYGIRYINKQSKDQKLYLSLPSIQSLRNYYENDKFIYYIDQHYGFYKYDKQKRNVSPIQAVNSRQQADGIKFFDMLYANKKFYIVGCMMDDVGRYLKRKQNAVIFIYNPEISPEKVIELDTGISYADTLLDIGDKIVGYGSYIEGYEGGDSATFGGIFSISKNTNTINTLSQIPISKMDFKTKPYKAKSVILHDRISEQTDLVYSDRDDKLIVSSSSTICQSNIRSGLKKGDKIPFDFLTPSGKLRNVVCMVSDEDYENHEKFINNFKKAEEERLDKIYLKLSKLSVVYDSIVVDKGQSEFKKY